MKDGKTTIIIIGAAGRDFHNFNTMYRKCPNSNVVAFTAAQIPDIDGRKYPAELAGEYYPDGIPIYAEEELPALIEKFQVDECMLSYSDLPYEKVMEIGSLVMACGAKFSMAGAAPTMIKSTKPLISITAVRTGCGKSQTTRQIVRTLLAAGKKVASIRHPMPYGDLVAQKVQRFEKLEDLVTHKCTIEEMEEYEPHIAMGSIIYAGVDYEAILREAEKEADVIIWDGGNNDMSFYKPDLSVVVADPLRAGDEVSYYPSEVNLRLADVVVINKIDSAYPEDMDIVMQNVRALNPDVQIVLAASSIRVTDPEIIKDKNVLVVEDGPTLTHGEMEYGAGTVAARRFGAVGYIDPRPYTVGKLSETFVNYPEIGVLLPAMGYGDEQMKDLETTINNTKCDSVVIGTPIDLGRFINIKHPSTRVYYELAEVSEPNLAMIIKDKFDIG